MMCLASIDVLGGFVEGDGDLFFFFLVESLPNFIHTTYLKEFFSSNPKAVPTSPHVR
jgi:hypothetical protein